MKNSEKLIELLSKNLIVVVNFSFIIFIVFWLLFFINPKISGTKLDRNKLNQITEEIKKIQEHQFKIDSSILNFNNKINEIDTNIFKVRETRIIIEKTLYEKNNIISNFTGDQIDSFFTDRYGFSMPMYSRTYVENDIE
jgi:septal ring factor EnvC (AmiA/AmiB activator)